MTPRVGAEAVIALLKSSEAEFGKREPQLSKDRPYYEDYKNLMIESWRRSFSSALP